RENRIDETCIASLQALQAFVTVQLVDETDIRHTDAGAFFRAHVFQATIERLRTEKKTAVQQGGAQVVGKQRTNGLARCPVLEIIHHRIAIRQQQALVLELYLFTQDALLLQPAQHALVERARQYPLFHQGIKCLQAELFANTSCFEQLQQVGIIHHRTTDDTAVNQAKQSGSDHLAAAVQTPVKRAKPADGLNLFTEVQRTGVGEQFTIQRIIVMSHQDVMHQRIAERTDTDLQHALVGNQGTGMQADTMILQRYRHVGRGKQSCIQRRLFDQQIEEPG